MPMERKLSQRRPVIPGLILSKSFTHQPQPNAARSSSAATSAPQCLLLRSALFFMYVDETALKLWINRKNDNYAILSSRSVEFIYSPSNGRQFGYDGAC